MSQTFASKICMEMNFNNSVGEITIISIPINEDKKLPAPLSL